MVPTDRYEVGNIIKTLKASSCPGIDQITVKTVKKLSEEIVDKLAEIYNRHITEGSYPDILKQATDQLHYNP